jgi:flagellar basal-body rod protein FlgF
VNEGPVAKASDSVKLLSGALEGSNVDPVRALTELIDISRQFEIHTRLMKSVEDDSTKANQLLNVTE